MTKPLLALSLALCAALGMACRNDGGLEPKPFEAPLKATVTANQFGGWAPANVAVKAGGTVTWAVPDGVAITEIWLNPYEPNEEDLKVVSGSVTHMFPTHGVFYYCAGCWDVTKAFSVTVY